MMAQDKLKYIRSIQIPTLENVSFLISILADKTENEIVQTAALLALKNAGETASKELVLRFNQTPIRDEETRIKLSYALSQIQGVPAYVFEKLIQDSVPKIRQNGIIGLSFQNRGKYDTLFYDVLISDLNPEIAFEAAAALAAGKERTLPLFKEILLNDSKNMKSKMSHSRLEDHVLGKVIEIVGRSEHEEKVMYIEPYLYHENSKVSNQVKEIMAESKNKGK